MGQARGKLTRPFRPRIRSARKFAWMTEFSWRSRRPWERQARRRNWSGFVSCQGRRYLWKYKIVQSQWGSIRQNMRNAAVLSAKFQSQRKVLEYTYIYRGSDLDPSALLWFRKINWWYTVYKIQACKFQTGIWRISRIANTGNWWASVWSLSRRNQHFLDSAISASQDTNHRIWPPFWDSLQKSWASHR